MALIQTPFHPFHVSLGAKMVPFAGYSLPLQYSGVIDEHECVRSAAGLFDLSHMGEIELRGDRVPAFLDRLLTNNISDLAPGCARYSTMCREDGGILDDLIVYNLEDRHLLVVNAGNHEKDIAWIRQHAYSPIDVVDANRSTALLAVQGPLAQEVVQRTTSHDLETLAYYGVAPTSIAEVSLILARTGYTGEDGFELYIPSERADEVWRSLVDAGKGSGMKPIGLAARDTLRLEMKYALYGNDIDESTSPLEAGLAWAVKLDKEFIGVEALRAQKAAGIGRRLVAFEAEGRRIPRQGYPILIDGREVGEVRSGTFSPSLRRAIGTAYVKRPHTKAGTEIMIMVRDRAIPARIVKPPFYKAGSLRRS